MSRSYLYPSFALQSLISKGQWYENLQRFVVKFSLQYVQYNVLLFSDE